jgi:hypothetical protein
MIVEGDEAPDKCPKCGVPKEKFVELNEEETNKIYQSDRTNDIHMEVIELASKIVQLSQEGIQIDLDPGCKKAFEKAKDEAWIIKQRCKAELQVHVNRGKW